MTLTEASYWTKKGGIIVGVAILFVLGIWQLVAFLYPGPKLPDKYIIANNGCGKVYPPSLTGLPLEVNFENLEIETETGKYPGLPKIVNVYKYEVSPDLGVMDIAKSLAKSLGFDPETIRREGQTAYIFTNTAKGKIMVVETRNQNFTISTNLSYFQPSSSSIIDVNSITSSAKSLITGLGIMPSNIDESKTITRYLLVTSQNNLQETASRIDADVLRIDYVKTKAIVVIEEEYLESRELGAFLQKELANAPKQRLQSDGKNIVVRAYNVPLVTEKPSQSNIFIVLAGAERYTTAKDSLLFFNYTNWPISEAPCGTYELIGEENAVQKIKTGNGYLVSLKLDGALTLDTVPADTVVTSLRVFDISLAYLDTSYEQEFLQPVYVFTGEANTSYGKADFVIYVPAIKY
ncbi:hypothetical protein JW962_03850 [Candidatus Dojkabacteria bacterium]|nr:hypothetical protein [Candidatus Dojkabacteria bacterium]